MLRTKLALYFMLAMIFNHATTSCESLVMHLPDYSHALFGLTEQIPHSHFHHHDAEQSSPLTDHPEYTHVPCFVSSELPCVAVHLASFSLSRLPLSFYNIGYSPPVPPPEY